MVLFRVLLPPLKITKWVHLELNLSLRWRSLGLRDFALLYVIQTSGFPLFRTQQQVLRRCLTPVHISIPPLFSSLAQRIQSDLHTKGKWFFIYFFCLDRPCLCFLFLQCAALVGEDQPLCPDLPELDLSELDVSDLDADSFLGGLKWYSDQSEIISAQYGNEASNLFEVSKAYTSSQHLRIFLLIIFIDICSLLHGELLFLSIMLLWNIFASTVISFCALPGVRSELE